MTPPDRSPLDAPACSSPAARRSLGVWLAGRIGVDAYAAMAERVAWEVSEPGGRCPTLVLCELEPAITIGRQGSRADVLLADDDLRARRIEVRFVGRGGGAVPHGPGQLFVALFAALEDLGLARHDVGGYVARFEAGLEAALRGLRCGPVRHPGVHGIFGRTGLLAAVSIAVRRGVASHGAFVNVAPPLELFGRVNSVPVAAATGSATIPRSMGSVEADLQRKVRMQDARTLIAQQIGDAFGFTRSHIQSGFPITVGAAGRAPQERSSRVG